MSHFKLWYVFAFLCVFLNVSAVWAAFVQPTTEPQMFFAILATGAAITTCLTWWLEKSHEKKPSQFKVE